MASRQALSRLATQPFSRAAFAQSSAALPLMPPTTTPFTLRHLLGRPRAAAKVPRPPAAVLSVRYAHSIPRPKVAAPTASTASSEFESELGVREASSSESAPSPAGTHRDRGLTAQPRSRLWSQSQNESQSQDQNEQNESLQPQQRRSRYQPPPKDQLANEQGLAPHYELTFTCMPCGARSAHRVSKQGYHHGSVLITCPSCRNRHIMSDHLGIFGTTSSGEGRTVEDILREKGRLVKKGTLGEDGDVEFWEDGTSSDRQTRLASEDVMLPRTNKKAEGEGEEEAAPGSTFQSAGKA